MTETFDIAYVGHYTKDTIVHRGVSKTIDGGAFYYGCNVIARMGLRAAVITHLAREDWGIIDELERLGVAVFAQATPHSTSLRLVYSSENLDERTIELTHSADAFTVDEVAKVNARAFIIGASSRGEVPTEVVDALASTGALIALDVQGFLRVAREGMLVADGWPEKEAVLPKVSVLKTDAVEAQLLTGEPDRRAAARRLAAYGASEVLITHSGGVLVHHDGVIHQAPLMPREVRGRSGRGDTCTAAYVARRLTNPPEDALAWAAAVTSLKLEVEGPYRREISEVESLYIKIRGLITSP